MVVREGGVLDERQSRVLAREIAGPRQQFLASPRRVGVRRAQAPRPVKRFEKQRAIRRFAEVGGIDDRLCVRVCRGKGQMTSARGCVMPNIKVYPSPGTGTRIRRARVSETTGTVTHATTRSGASPSVLRARADVGERLRMLRLGRRKKLAGAIHIAGTKAGGPAGSVRRRVCRVELQSREPQVWRPGPNRIASVLRRSNDPGGQDDGAPASNRWTYRLPEYEPRYASGVVEG